MPRRRHDDSGKYTRLADFSSIHRSIPAATSKIPSSVPQASGDREVAEITCQVVCHQVTEAEFDREFCCHNGFSDQCQKENEIEIQGWCIRRKIDTIFKNSWTGQLTQPFEET